MTTKAEVRRYTALMTKAATGDRKAARALLLSKWWPGDPESEASQDHMIGQAQKVAEWDADTAVTAEEIEAARGAVFDVHYAEQRKAGVLPRAAAMIANERSLRIETLLSKRPAPDDDDRRD